MYKIISQHLYTLYSVLTIQVVACGLKLLYMQEHILRFVGFFFKSKVTYQVSYCLSTFYSNIWYKYSIPPIKSIV